MAACPVKLSIWRGVAGFSLLIAAFMIFPRAPLGFVVLLLGALYFFKGCPACWVSSLSEAVRLKKSKSAEEGAPPPASPGA